MGNPWHCVSCGTALSQVGYSHCNVCKQTNTMAAIFSNLNSNNHSSGWEEFRDLIYAFIQLIFWVVLGFVMYVIFKG
jgi:hypothetical protein